MKIYYFLSLLSVISFISCSKPTTKSKFTQSLSLSKKLYINDVIFTNIQDDKFPLNEEEIERELLQRFLNNKYQTQKTIQLKLALLAIKDKNIQKESRLNLHNIFAVTAMLTTGVTPDTSTIENAELKQKLFILKIILGKEETKLFIEIDNYQTIKELKEVFKKELFHKIEKLIK